MAWPKSQHCRQSFQSFSSLLQLQQKRDPAAPHLSRASALFQESDTHRHTHMLCARTHTPRYTQVHGSLTGWPCLGGAQLYLPGGALTCREVGLASEAPAQTPLTSHLGPPQAEAVD